MIYLSGVVGNGMIPMILTPNTGNRLPPDVIWAADNGRYTDKKIYTNERYLAWLTRLAYAADRCLFAAAPDVVGDASATLAMSALMYARIRELGYRPALVAQDGLTPEMVPWDEIDAVFIGGSTEWKLGEDARLVAADGVRRGKWVHMGRVNSHARLAYAESIGCDSADGTVLKHDPGRDVAGWTRRVIANPSLWRPTREVAE